MPPQALTAAHLVHALAPATPEPDAGDPRAHLQLGIARVDALVEIADAWRLRFPLLPEPPARETLAELVQAARRRLRDDRVRADLDELDARRFVLTSVHAELQP